MVSSSPKRDKQRAASPGHVDAAGQQVSAAAIYLECLSIVAIRGTKLWGNSPGLLPACLSSQLAPSPAR